MSFGEKNMKSGKRKGKCEGSMSKNKDKGEIEDKSV
jgi:hypothetical protein